MTTLAEIEAQVAEQRKADARRLAAARRKADEDLGARLRDLIAPDRPRAEQVEAATRWLDGQQAARQPEHSEGH